MSEEMLPTKRKPTSIFWDTKDRLEVYKPPDAPARGKGRGKCPWGLGTGRKAKLEGPSIRNGVPQKEGSIGREKEKQHTGGFPPRLEKAGVFSHGSHIFFLPYIIIDRDGCARGRQKHAEGRENGRDANTTVFMLEGLPKLEGHRKFTKKGWRGAGWKHQARKNGKGGTRRFM